MMSIIAAIYLRLRERSRRISTGQTMTEYVLILAGVAAVVFVTFHTMGNDVVTNVNRTNTDLTTAS